VTGLTTIEAILKGERNPQTLAALRDGLIRASEDTISKSLVGDYRPEHLFTLRQSLEAFRHSSPDSTCEVISTASSE
jgi:transposase